MQRSSALEENSSLIVLIVSHLSPDIAMPLNLLAGDTDESYDLVLLTPHKKKVYFTCKVCGSGSVLRILWLMKKSIGNILFQMK